MFRLDKVLHVRERQEREARARRLAAEARARELSDAADRLHEERLDLPDGESGDPEDLAGWVRYAEGLRRRETAVRSRLEELRPHVDAAVRAHQELHREVEGLKRLRERTLQRRRKRQERRAQEAMDDVASRPFVPGGGNDFRPPTGPSPTEVDRPGRETASAAAERPNEGRVS